MVDKCSLKITNSGAGVAESNSM